MTLQADLFVEPKKISNKRRVFEFIKAKGWARTSEVNALPYTNRAMKDARDLAKEAREYFMIHKYWPPEGYIRRMDDGWKELRFPGCREDVWEFREG